MEQFPSIDTGAPIANIRCVPKYKLYQKDLANLDNPWAPFSLQLDWEVAHWAKFRGPSSTAFSEFLKINGVSVEIRASYIVLTMTLIQVCECLGLSYQSTQQLNNIINSSLPEIPRFE